MKYLPLVAMAANLALLNMHDPVATGLALAIAFIATPLVFVAYARQRLLGYQVYRLIQTTPVWKIWAAVVFTVMLRQFLVSRTDNFISELRVMTVFAPIILGLAVIAIEMAIFRFRSKRRVEPPENGAAQ